MTSMLRLLTTLVCAAASHAAAHRISLNREWHLRIDPDGKGAAQGWSSRVPQGVERVVVPHTWNIGQHADYEGSAWYFRTFPAPHRTAQNHVELQFDATLL